MLILCVDLCVKNGRKNKDSTGKGDWRRPMSISESKYSNRWNKIFKKDKKVRGRDDNDKSH